jgi:hypothetical protein
VGLRCECCPLLIVVQSRSVVRGQRIDHEDGVVSVWLQVQGGRVGEAAGGGERQRVRTYRFVAVYFILHPSSRGLLRLSCSEAVTRHAAWQAKANKQSPQ